MQTAINIGPSKEAVQELTNAIISILEVPFVDNSTKVVALEVLNKGIQVGPASISNCNFTINPEKPVRTTKK